MRRTRQGGDDDFLDLFEGQHEFGKRLVDRGLRLLINVSLLGTSNVTYLWFIHHRPDGYSAKSVSMN